MKISETIEMLKELKQIEGDCEIFLMSDAEGNGYSKMTNSYGTSFVLDDDFDYLYDEQEVEEILEDDDEITEQDFKKVITLWRS